MIPQIHEISSPYDAETVFAAFAPEPNSVFLDSAKDLNGLGRYSIIVRDPFLIFSSKGDQITLTDKSGRRTFTGDAFACLKDLLAKYKTEKAGHLPFCGGVVGFWSYDLAYRQETIAGLSRDDLSTPDCYVGFYDTAIVFDHYQHKTYIVSTGYPETTADGRRQRIADRIAEFTSLISKSTPLCPTVPPLPVGNYHSNFSSDAYRVMIQKAIDYIFAGDIFQANLSQRFTAPLPAAPFSIYRYLRQINPAPFAAYLNCGDLVIASASPERFLSLRSGLAETRPIKGTRPRGSDAASDRRLREELQASEKDRSELVMIVDLERNDLGRVCEYGTVKVPDLLRVEEYATVFHLVATVTGQLRPDKTAIDLLRASFPGGSISGAPKVRAMQIIDELEPVRRGIYTGSIGYIDFNGDMDLNIVIRTLVIKDSTVYFQAGGGIVADSSPEEEYLETFHKAKALFAALGYEVNTGV